MTIRNSTNLVTEERGAWPAAGMERGENSASAECWSLLSGRMGELLPLFFSRLDDDLFKLSEKAETNALQSLFFDSMRYLRRERGGVQANYMQALAARYQEYWGQVRPASKVKPQSLADMEEGGFDLMEDEALEESLAVNGMVEKNNTLYQHELFPLNERFCSLLGEEREIASLPVSPEVLSKEFEQVLKSLEIDLKVKLFVYKIFDRQILNNLGQVYHELNSLLIARGVLPTIARNIKRQPAQEYANQAAQSFGYEESPEAAAYLETFRSMQSMMDAWRQQMGVNSFASIMADAIIADSKEVLGALNSIQLPSDSLPQGDESISGETLKQYLALQLEKLKGDNQARALGRPEEDIIDMVGMIFDFILDDNNLAASIKGLIARLQIPVIKVAILDKSFFAKKTHPARALLNALAQAGISLGSTEVEADNPVLRKVEEVVGRVLHEFDQDTSLFQELLDDFTAFVDKESQRSKIAEDRTRQVTQSKEKLWLAKKAVASEITSRLQGKETSPVFRSFLYNDWKDVLVLAYLRQERMDGEWERCLEIMDKLIWSVMPPSTLQERQEVIRSIPGLIKSIKQGLEGISLDPHQVASLLKDLEVCHMSALRSQPTPKPEHSHVQESTHVSPTCDVNIKDAELAEAIMEIRSHLPDISNIEIEEVVMADTSPETVPNPEVDYIHQGEFMNFVNRLKVGDWMEFLDENERPWRAKLSWKSQATSQCVFVNRRGVKVLELKMADLVLRLRQGRARVIEDPGVPLMDRALNYLMQSLKSPFAKASPAGAGV